MKGNVQTFAGNSNISKNRPKAPSKMMIWKRSTWNKANGTISVLVFKFVRSCLWQWTVRGDSGSSGKCGHWWR
jgi:hypothetical protein